MARSLIGKMLNERFLACWEDEGSLKQRAPGNNHSTTTMKTARISAGQAE